MQFSMSHDCSNLARNATPNWAKLGLTLGKADRYILSQLLVLFGFFSLVLVSVYWINRAVSLFDTLIGSGHSTLVFLEFSALSLPSVISIALPLAVFASACYVANRLITESEMVILQTTGYSPWRLARPFLMFGVIVAGMMSLLTHYLVPASHYQLAVRTQEISQSVTAKLLTDGTFLHPSEGITFYIREITPEGKLEDVFLSDNRDPAASTVFTAQEAFLVRDDEGSKLVMVDGMAQSLTEDGRLSITNFQDLTYDVSSLVSALGPPGDNIIYRSTFDLIFRPAQTALETGTPIGRVLEHGHQRIHQPLLCVIVAMIACSTLIMGSFSRFGPGRFIVGAFFILVFIKIIESAVADPVRSNPDLWPLIYLPTLAGIGIYIVQQAATSGTVKSPVSRMRKGGAA